MQQSKSKSGTIEKMSHIFMVQLVTTMKMLVDVLIVNMQKNYIEIKK
jgi:hypothetical protein